MQQAARHMAMVTNHSLSRGPLFDPPGLCAHHQPTVVVSTVQVTSSPSHTCNAAFTKQPTGRIGTVQKCNVHVPGHHNVSGPLAGQPTDQGDASLALAIHAIQSQALPTGQLMPVTRQAVARIPPPYQP